MRPRPGGRVGWWEGGRGGFGCWGSLPGLVNQCSLRIDLDDSNQTHPPEEMPAKQRGLARSFFLRLVKSKCVRENPGLE